MSIVLYLPQQKRDKTQENDTYTNCPDPDQILPTPQQQATSAPLDNITMNEPKSHQSGDAASNDGTEKVESPKTLVDNSDEENGKVEDNTLAPKTSAGSTEQEYPPPIQVAIIMICILSAIFLMSLVSRGILKILIQATCSQLLRRIVLSLELPFPRSPTSSTAWTTLDGMEALSCSQPAASNSCGEKFTHSTHPSMSFWR
jgi:hypothetical protein